MDGAAGWMQHWDFADRAGYLGEHLSAALDLAERALYPSSLSLVRTAMEHQVVDELLLLGSLYEEVLPGTTPERHAEILSAWRAGEAWASNVEAVHRRGKSTVLVRHGHDVRDDETGQVVEVLSNYFVVLEHHDATLGTPGIQDLFHDGIGDVEQIKRWARDNDALYRSHLRWSALAANLVLNDLVDSRQQVALGVHYRFLSAFTHATATGYELIDRHTANPSWGRHRPSHVLGELVLLYVANIAHDELRVWQASVDARPGLITLANRPRSTESSSCPSSLLGTSGTGAESRLTTTACAREIGGSGSPGTRLGRSLNPGPTTRQFRRTRLGTTTTSSTG